MTVAEDSGIGTRGNYYDKAGALRDIVQNHMFQLLTLLAMEPPFCPTGGDTTGTKKSKFYSAVKPFTQTRRQGGCRCRGKITATATSPMSDPIREPRQVCRDALAWRWNTTGAGRAFRSTCAPGKLPDRRVKRRLPCTSNGRRFTLFRNTPIESLESSILLLRIQPDEGISLAFHAKVPGPFRRLGIHGFQLRGVASGAEPATGYETLLFDAMNGDQTLFHRLDIVEAGWQVADPILNAWESGKAKPFAMPKPGSWAPEEAQLLLERDNRCWRD